MRPAASCVGDDGVEIGQVERIDQSTREIGGGGDFAAVGLQRTSEDLNGRRVNFTAIG